MGSVERDFLGHLDRLASGSMPAAQFWRWLVLHADRIEESASDGVVELARGIDNRFAEWTGGAITEEQLVEAIRGDLLNGQGDVAWPRSA